MSGDPSYFGTVKANGDPDVWGANWGSRRVSTGVYEVEAQPTSVDLEDDYQVIDLDTEPHQDGWTETPTFTGADHVMKVTIKNAAGTATDHGFAFDLRMKRDPRGPAGKNAKSLAKPTGGYGKRKPPAKPTAKKKPKKGGGY